LPLRPTNPRGGLFAYPQACRRPITGWRGGKQLRTQAGVQRGLFLKPGPAATSFLNPFAQRYLDLFSSLPPRLQQPDFTIELRPNDYLDINCPHYQEPTARSNSVERYTLYLVNREDYDSCEPKSKDQVRWECKKPHAIHGPERFSEKFQRYTPFSLGKEFKPGHYYYYICEYRTGDANVSRPLHRPELLVRQGWWQGGRGKRNLLSLPAKPVHHHGEQCLRARVYVCCKRGTDVRLRSHATQPSLPADEPGVDLPSIQKSTGSSRALVASLGLTLLLMLSILLL
ncbi:hypothetical protein chiPu_0022689, partial [Chiloscyllium punctatum]|nr:hypothetical protein [Chiloscyllium punctatum]